MTQPRYRSFCYIQDATAVGTSMSKLDFLRGAYCPLIVPFSDGKIDFDAYGKLIERQIVDLTVYFSMRQAASLQR